MNDYSYKIDWLSFSVGEQYDILEGRKFQVLKLLGYDIDDFQSISGRFFYNAGLTLGNYVNVYYNEHEIEKLKGQRIPLPMFLQDKDVLIYTKR